MAITYSRYPRTKTPTLTSGTLLPSVTTHAPSLSSSPQQLENLFTTPTTTQINPSQQLPGINTPTTTSPPVHTTTPSITTPTKVSGQTAPFYPPPPADSGVMQIEYPNIPTGGPSSRPVDQDARTAANDAAASTTETPGDVTDGAAETPGDSTDGAVDGQEFSQDVLDFAEAHGYTPEYANAIINLAEVEGVDPELYAPPSSETTTWQAPSDETQASVNELFAGAGYDSNEEEIKKLWEDMMSGLDENWEAKQQALLQRGAIGNRMAAAANAESGRSLGGGFLAGQRQADIATQGMLANASIAQQDMLRGIKTDMTNALVDEKRLESQYGMDLDKLRVGLLTAIGSNDAESVNEANRAIRDHVFRGTEMERSATLGAEGAAGGGSGDGEPVITEPSKEVLDAFGKDNVVFDEENGLYHINGATVGIPEDAAMSFVNSAYLQDPMNGMTFKAPRTTEYADIEYWRNQVEGWSNKKLQGNAFSAWASDWAKDHNGNPPTKEQVTSEFLNNPETRKKYEFWSIEDYWEQYYIEDLANDPQWDQSMDKDKKAREFAEYRAKQSMGIIYGMDGVYPVPSR